MNGPRIANANVLHSSSACTSSAGGDGSARGVRQVQLGHCLLDVLHPQSHIARMCSSLLIGDLSKWNLPAISRKCKGACNTFHQVACSAPRESHMRFAVHHTSLSRSCACAMRMHGSAMGFGLA